jgi:anti-sigma factor RsiW
MTCAQCLSMADAYLDNELPVETSHDVSAHVGDCAACRAELEARRALRARLRLAFGECAELAAPPLFASDLRARLQQGQVPAQRQHQPRRWLALAAAAVVLAGAAAVYALWDGPGGRPTVVWARMAAHAAGDHRYCALQHALEEPPISLAEAAQRYDSVYGRLREVVEASAPVRDGEAVVVAAHSCVFDRRRFAHVVIRRGGRVLSVLVTSGDGPPVRATAVAPCGSADGFQMACAGAGRHVVFLVSDLGADETLAVAAGFLPAVQDHLEGASQALTGLRGDSVRMAGLTERSLPPRTRR